MDTQSSGEDLVIKVTQMDSLLLDLELPSEV